MASEGRGTDDAGRRYVLATDGRTGSEEGLTVPDRHGPYRTVRFLLEIDEIAIAGFSERYAGPLAMPRPGRRSLRRRGGDPGTRPRGIEPIESGNR